MQTENKAAQIINLETIIHPEEEKPHEDKPKLSDDEPILQVPKKKHVNRNTPAFTVKNPTTPEEIQSVIDDMRAHFDTGATLSLRHRLKLLTNMRRWLKDHETEVLDALQADLGKSHTEGYMTELGLVYEEIDAMTKNLWTWARPVKAKTPLMLFPSRSEVYPTPYGVAAVLSPWNYPIQLCLIPMVDAIAAGNCVFAKPSKTAKHTGAVIKRMVDESFDPRSVYCVFDLPNLDDNMLKMRVDYMFFTGSPRVAHEIMHACANNLTPMTLELGGKSPCIVGKTAHLGRAGQRIAWGKCLNSGQTCVAPDYLLVHEDVVDKLVAKIDKSLHKYFGDDILANKDYPHMITQAQFERVCGLIDSVNPNAEIVVGGHRDANALKIEPTIIKGVSLDDPIMGEEIFGPVLPIITWKTTENVMNVMHHFPRPLACYIFSEDQDFQQQIVNQMPFGGGCINDVVVQVSNNEVGFGGIGNSGMGTYHGKKGFDCFTHYKSIINTTAFLGTELRNPPYKPWKMRLAKLFMH